MTARRLGIALAVFGLAVAGCFDKSPDSSAGPDSATSPSSAFVDAFKLRPELVDCRFMPNAVLLAKSEVQDLLPPGYTAQGSTTTWVNLNLLECDSMVVDNATVLRPFSWGATFAIVDVNETLSSDADVNLYMLEAFVSNQTAMELLEGLGFSVTLAHLDYETDGTTSLATVAVSGRTWYTATGANGAGVPVDYSETARIHQVSVTGRSIWIDQRKESTFDNFAAVGSLDTDDGVLHDLAPPGAGPHPSGTQAGTSRSSWAFGKS